MQTKLLVLMSLVIFTACTNNPVADLNNEATPATSSKFTVASKTVPQEPVDEKPKTENQEKAAVAQKDEAAKSETVETPKPKQKSAQELAAEKAAVAQANAIEKARLGKVALAKLIKEYTAASSQWRSGLRNVKPADRAAALEANPINEYGQKFVDLAEEYSGTDVATEALKSALTRGAGEAKTVASNRLLELAEMESGPNTKDIEKIKTEAILMTLAQSGATEAKDKAITMLMNSAQADLESDASAKILDRILSLRGTSEAKNKAAELVLKLADNDVRSNKAAEQLAKVATSAEGDVKSAALTRLVEHHVNSDKVVDIMNSMARAMPSEATEKFLKEVCRKATSSKVKGNAAVALSSYINRRDMYRNFYGDAEESVREKLDQNMLAYLEIEPDPNEAVMIESIMDSYVKDNEKLIEKVKKELFVVQNLSVGKTAPEITATDLDGIEFSLSDYRGKVVFLDFWGDW